MKSQGLGALITGAPNLGVQSLRLPGPGALNWGVARPGVVELVVPRASITELLNSGHDVARGVKRGSAGLWDG